MLAVTMLKAKHCQLGLKLKSAGVSLLGVGALVGIQVATPKADQFEVVHYDSIVPAAAVTTASDAEGMEVFAAPGDVFEPPGGVFEAPGEPFAAPGEVFEPPSATSTTSAELVAPVEPRTGDAQQATQKDGQPSVTTTLLLIAPPRLLQLTHLIFSMPCSDDDETPTTTETEKPETSENASTEPKEEEASSDAEKSNDETSTQSTESKPSEDKAAPTDPPAPERRLLTFAGNRFTLDVKQWPLLGKSDAKYIFVEMFDYTCPHCRNTHHAIAGAQKQYGDELAIFALPVPLENACNPAASGSGHPGACELARIAIAVWRLDPSKFQQFHDWMFETQRTSTSALQFAETLVGKERLKSEMASGVPGQYISRHVSLYQRVGSGQVPKLIFPSTTMQGEVNSVTTLCQAIERELAVAKK